MNIKQLQRSAAQTTALILEDLEILLDTKNPEEIWNHPEKKEAFRIVADYRHRSPATVKIRVQTLVDMINGKAYESIAPAATQYLKGALNLNALTDEQSEKAFASLANAK
jgi:hypothetical protein